MSWASYFNNFVYAGRLCIFYTYLSTLCLHKSDLLSDCFLKFRYMCVVFLVKGLTLLSSSPFSARYFLWLFTVFFFLWTLELYLAVVFLLCLTFVLLRQKGGVFFVLDWECFFKPVKWFLSQNGQRESLLVCDWLHSVLLNHFNVMCYIIRDAIYFRAFILDKCFKMIKEDSVQIPIQKSWIPSFCPGGPVTRPNTHQCPQVSSSSRLHPSERSGNASERSSVFNKKLDFLLRHIYGKTTACIHPDNRTTALGRYLWEGKTWRRIATVQTSRQHCKDTVLIMVFTCSKSATVWTLGQHRPEATLI